MIFSVTFIYKKYMHIYTHTFFQSNFLNWGIQTILQAACGPSTVLLLGRIHSLAKKKEIKKSGPPWLHAQVSTDVAGTLVTSGVCRKSDMNI